MQPNSPVSTPDLSTHRRVPVTASGATDPGPPDPAAPESCLRQPPNWEWLVRRYRRPLRAVARRLLRIHGLPAGAEDIHELLQDLWCRIFERAGDARLEESNGALSYLLRTLRNLAIDRLRSARAQKRGGLRRRVGLGALSSLPAPGASPEERLLSGEERRRILGRCRQLTGSSRWRRDLAVLERALLDGWSSRQISRALDGALAPSSVDSLVHRLRRRFAAEGIELPRRS